MAALDPAIVQFAEELPQINPPHDLSFPAVLEAALTALEKYPETWWVQFQQDQGLGPDEMYFNAAGFAGFAAFSAVYRTRWLLDDVVSGLNDTRPLRAISAARGVVECAATLRAVVRDLLPFLEQMGEAYQEAQELLAREDLDEEAFQDAFRQNKNKYAGGLHEVTGVLAHHSVATRVDWEVLRSEDSQAFAADLEAVSDEVKQRNVLTLLGKYTKDKANVQLLRSYYALQCDYTHPNRGGHQLVTQTTDLSDNIISYSFAYNPAPGIPLNHAVRAVYTPLVMVLPQLVEDIETLFNMQQEFSKMWFNTIKPDFESVNDQS